MVVLRKRGTAFSAGPGGSYEIQRWVTVLTQAQAYRPIDLCWLLECCCCSVGTAPCQDLEQFVNASARFMDAFIATRRGVLTLHCVLTPNH